MGVYLYDGETEHLKCGCGDGWEESDLYSCDICGKVLCEECKVITDDDCPNDYCESCIGIG